MLKAGVYGAPPGADFPAALVAGLRSAYQARPPEDMARVTIFTNTRRMQRRVISLFSAGPACLLPRLRLVEDIGRDPLSTDPSPSASPLRRFLELSQLVRALIRSDPGVAPETGVFELTRTLAALLAEMQIEGVGFDRIEALETGDVSGHWERSRAFLSLVGTFLADDSKSSPGPEARLRRATMQLIQSWEQNQPADPVIVAGSTGSRGTTLSLMSAVAQLKTGILILPGFDFDTPADVWKSILSAADADGTGVLTGEDHPQFRFAKLLQRIGLTPDDVIRWPGADAPDPARNKLISMSLRPAPVTDQWLRDGPLLGDQRSATNDMTLIEAPGQRDEARVIALIMREALESGKTVALVSPDRLLTRRVAAALDRWNIEPDDSAGRPLALSPPGRLLRQMSRLLSEPCTAQEFLSLLKNPLVSSGIDRGPHLLMTRELELYFRSSGVHHINSDNLNRWARDQDESAKKWVSWLIGCLPSIRRDPGHVTEMLTGLLDCCERLAAGPGGSGAGQLWNHAEGRKAREVILALGREADYAGSLNAFDFDSLLNTVLQSEDVRDPTKPHPGVMIWGTLEARVQGADRVILAGLNEGSWPELPSPDPWLNRHMRAQAGMLLPDRKIGLSAHDYQQAAAAPEVFLCRSMRDADAEPVPSRWLNRMTNLLGGLHDQAGSEALELMRQRGTAWLEEAAALETASQRVAPAKRPSPRPPVNARPRQLSVTAIERLIRDPYAIYARYILRLRRLNPLNPGPDAPLRGQVLHLVFDRFMREGFGATDPRSALLRIADEVLSTRAPWPMARKQWRARIERVADWFIAQETKRALDARFLAAERKGRLILPEIGFALTATADRLDRLPNGDLAVLDYKTGSPPTTAVMEAFDKQLLLEALIAEAGGFEGVPPASVDHVAHIGLGSNPVYRVHRLEDTDDQHFALPTVRNQLLRLLRQYQAPDQGYTCRHAMQKVGFEGDYDHLARYGEWDETDSPTGVSLG